MSQAIAAIHPRFKTPWVATIFTGTIGIVLVLTTNVVTLSTWTGVALAIDYALIALAALVSRVTQPNLNRPYRMPLWPIAPLFAIAGCVITLTKQTGKDLRIAGIVAAGSLAYYYIYLHPRRKTHWLKLNPIKDDDS